MDQVQRHRIRDHGPQPLQGLGTVPGCLIDLVSGHIF
jgi:hypothetical protein